MAQLWLETSSDSKYYALSTKSCSLGKLYNLHTQLQEENSQHI